MCRLHQKDVPVIYPTIDYESDLHFHQRVSRYNFTSNVKVSHM